MVSDNGHYKKIAELIWFLRSVGSVNGVGGFAILPTVLGTRINEKWKPNLTCFHFLSLDVCCLCFMCLIQFCNTGVGYQTIIVNKTNSGLGLPYNWDPSPSFISSLGPCKWISLATMALNISLLVGQLDFCICIVGQTNKIWAVPF